MLGSKDLPAHKAWQANVASRARPVLRDRQDPRVSQGRQALCVTPKALEILSRAMMAKFLFRPFARTVLPPFKELLGPNAAHPEWLASACESSAIGPFSFNADREAAMTAFAKSWRTGPNLEVYVRVKTAGLK